MIDGGYGGDDGVDDGASMCLKYQYDNDDDNDNDGDE